MQEVMQYMAGALFFGAFIPYSIQILRGKAHPSKATWIVWAVMDIMIMVQMKFQGNANGQIIGASLGAGFVAAIVIKYGEPGWTLMEKICMGLSGLGLVFWLATGDAFNAMLISLAVLLIGSITTVQKAWNDPAGEDKLTWFLWVLSGICAFAGIPSWAVADAAQPIVFFAIDVIVIGVIFISPRFDRRTNAAEGDA